MLFLPQRTAFSSYSFPLSVSVWGSWKKEKFMPPEASFWRGTASFFWRKMTPFLFLLFHLSDEKEAFCCRPAHKNVFVTTMLLLYRNIQIYMLQTMSVLHFSFLIFLLSCVFTFHFLFSSLLHRPSSAGEHWCGVPCSRPTYFTSWSCHDDVTFFYDGDGNSAKKKWTGKI